MNDPQAFEEMPDPEGSSNVTQNAKYARLATWLLQVFESTSQEEASISEESQNDNQLAINLRADYHLQYYQQLPDFAMAMLTEDVQAAVQYSSLLYHLVSCHECHSAYLDLYDALRAAVDPQGFRPLLGQGTRTLAATPHRVLGHFCQMLISQAEAVLRQAHRDHSDGSAAARSLLQIALHVSAYIGQSTIRRQALHDLVRVATLFEGPTAPMEDQENAYAYTLAPTSGIHRGKVLRRPGILLHSHSQEQNAIEIQSNGLKGRIVQNGQKLELHLQDLDTPLRGRYLTISVLLGSLIEPVRWRGGNPQAISSNVPVDAAGMLITPLGNTEMKLSDPEERNLLEAMFMILKVRASD